MYAEETSTQDKQITRSRDEVLWGIKKRYEEGNLKSDIRQQKGRTTARKVWQTKDLSVWAVLNIHGFQNILGTN